MGYGIKCYSEGCQEWTWANNIVELIKNHTDVRGKLICNKCGNNQAAIYKESILQEKNGQKNKKWPRFIQGVIPIVTDSETYTPYVFLTSDTEDGDINGVHFNYYKDTRHEVDGKLKHGHGPGGAPVFSKEELLQLLGRLIGYSFLSKKEINDYLNSIP